MEDSLLIDQTVSHAPSQIDFSTLDSSSLLREQENVLLSKVGIEPSPHSNAGNLNDGYQAKGIPPVVDVPSSAQISDNSPDQGRAPSHREDGDPAVTKGVNILLADTPSLYRASSASCHKSGLKDACKMHRFSLYETSSRFYIVGGDILDQKFRILKVDRTVESGDLRIDEDESVYTKSEMNEILNTVDNGNKSTGGIRLKCNNSWGLLGFIRFTSAYYMLVITKRNQVAMIGGHYIYQVEGTELIPLTPVTSRFKLDSDPEEARFIGILNNLDLSRFFYFSYSYDITRTLQNNICDERAQLRNGFAESSFENRNDMFVWNHHLLEPASRTIKNIHDWCIPIIHGFVDQASKSSIPSGGLLLS